ncbi:MAG TPA: response regulator [Roseiflexaceae bacterium]
MKIYRRPRHSAITASRRPSAQRRAQQLRLLQKVSHQIAAATAIENARLYQAEQQRRSELEALQSIALKLGGDLDLDTVLRTVVEGVASVFNADAASVLMPLDEGTATAEVAKPPPAAVSACRVLVVDDEPSVRDVLARILRHGGHDVTTAASGEDALEHFAPGQYDLLFTDLSMPGMGGAALLRHLRALDPNLIGVVVTGWGQQDGVGDRLPEAAAVVAKPFSADRIAELVGELIGARAV